MVAEAQGVLTCRSSTLAILADFGPFHGLLLIDLGFQSDFMVTEPQCALTCRSLTLAVLADSGPIRGLLLTVFGSRSDFLALWTPRCAYVHDINTRHFGRFWPISWTITHCFGARE